MKKVLLMGTLAVLLMAGCGTKEEAVSEEAQIKQETEAEVQAEEEAKEEKVSEIFQSFPDTFSYGSGAGGWSTELTLNDDGTFVGEYSDSDMGVTGADYPNGTVYISKFHGKFTEPEMINEYSYSMSVEFMELDAEEGTEYIEDGVRYIVLGEEELATGEELTVYLPDTTYENLPEDFMSWIPMSALGPENLKSYAIYNGKYEAYYIGEKFMSDEDVKKLDGTYQNENGDVVTIHIYPDEERETYDIGMIDWNPVNEEAQVGTIQRNAKGGFAFYLEASTEYNFEVTNNEAGEIEFVGVGKYPYEGTFVMQK